MHEEMKPARWDEIIATRDPHDLPFLPYFRALHDGGAGDEAGDGAGDGVKELSTLLGARPGC